jgi:transcription termination factor NusB
LEKATLIYASQEIIFNQNVFAPALINQIVEFSKKHLDQNKYKYINKVLDLLFKDLEKKL